MHGSFYIFMMLDIMTILMPPVLFKHGHGFLWNFFEFHGWSINNFHHVTTSPYISHIFPRFLAEHSIDPDQSLMYRKKTMVGISPHFNWSYHLHQSTSTTASRIRKISPKIQRFTAPLSGWWLSPTPLKNDGVRQLGWHSQLDGKIIQMFQTTNSTSH